MLKRLIPILILLFLLAACTATQSEPTAAPTLEIPVALPTEAPVATTPPTDMPVPTEIPAATETQQRQLLMVQIISQPMSIH